MFWFDINAILKICNDAKIEGAEERGYSFNIFHFEIIFYTNT